MKKDITIIFDLDGTLLNTDLLIRKSFEHVFSLYKPDYKISEEEHMSFLGPTLHDSFSRYFDEDIVEELIECYRDYNHEHHEDYVTIYPSVIETLQYLIDKDYKLAVVTTKFSKAAYIGLDLFDITKYFDVVIGMDNVRNVKPNPEGIYKVLENTKTSKAIMIGDNQSDILAGKNASIYTIGVKWTPKGTKEMDILNPDLMIDQMDEIIQFIERMN